MAIIGTGTIGSTLAADFAAGGQDFVLAGRDEQAARAIAAGLGGHAQAVSVDEAVDRAGVLVIAVWLDDFRQFIARYGPRLAGKVIIDPTNPVGPDGAGGYRKVIGEQESSGQILAGLARRGPAGQGVRHTVGPFAGRGRPAGARPGGAVLRRRRRRSRDLVAGLIRAAGFDPVQVGGLDQSIRIEMFGDLHEYGALGGVVTRTEALKAL